MAGFESTQTISLGVIDLFRDTPALDKARSHFPAQKTGYIYADNAGGSQIPQDVANRIAAYLLYSNVQFGAGYSVCVQSGRSGRGGCDEAVECDKSRRNRIRGKFNGEYGRAD
ncbi:hypothetical protein CCMSSC00406_0008261 [Pleurotus cornucopiae]|uniref:Uncharacterized protein n=1 Tax=Pleurotus cornucopiae TaxID=5321 RepID=A0ACB7JCN3_PLECO|nr:hypothetical protein CCMSSC00406_0008261 [Pleurotus cornucopiae]